MDCTESLEKFEQYLQRRFPERRTAIDYLSDVRQFMATCEKAWRDVTMHDIDAFVDAQRARGLQPATVTRRVAALKTFFDFLAEETADLSWPNPVRFKRHAGKRPQHLPRDLRDEDIAQVWAQITTPRDRAWFVLMLRAGLRVGEIIALQAADVLSPPTAAHPGRVRVCGKGRKERVVWLTADAYAVLETWLRERPATPDPHLFLNRRGQPLTANGLQWLLHRYGQQAGLDLTPHQLRHTFARQLTEVGLPVTSLSKLLGHSQISTTQIYTAGADPALAHAYQTAMEQLAQAAPPPPPPSSSPALTAVIQPEPVGPPPAAQVAAPVPALPDWAAWEPQLPPAIRQASLDYVQRRLHTWPARHRRERAWNVLRALRGLWRWFLAQRPMTHPGELGLQDLWAYQTDQQAQGYAVGTINRRLDYVVGIARELAERDQPVDHSVLRLRYLPRPQSLPRHLTETESQRLEAYLRQRLTTPDPRVRLENACLFLLLHSGLRAGECVDVRIQDLDLPGQRLIVRQGKGQRDRVVYLSAITCHAIQLYLLERPGQPHDLLWRHQNGQPLSTDWLRSHVTRIGHAVGIAPLFPHRLRHTCATRLVNAGMEITRIQKLLGHQMISTTMIYARVYDATVEADYRRALERIEAQQAPLSAAPIAVCDWPTRTVTVPAFDNSV